MGPLVVVAGTGTEIGKTHVAAALLRAWGDARRVIGYKPIETGVPPGPAQPGSDAWKLERASTFHVKQPLARQTFLEPISPHLAARHAGSAIDLAAIVAQTKSLRLETEGTLVELAGGLFSPLGPMLTNADLAAALEPTHLILIAPDRLGVLHDVGATLRAATAIGVRLGGVVLSAPTVSDASTGTNGLELQGVWGAAILSEFPRAGLDAESTRQAALRLARSLGLP
jgi:dethiobiotin synthetase